MTISLEISEEVSDAGQCLVYIRRWVDKITGMLVRQDVHVHVKEGFDLNAETNS